MHILPFAPDLIISLYPLLSKYKEEKRKRKPTGRKTCDLVSDRYSSGHAENNTPFVHHSFGGTLPPREKAADTKHFAAPGLAKSKYRRFSRPAPTAMHKRHSKDQVGLNCNVRSDTVRALGERDLPCQLINRENLDSGDASREMCYDKKAFRKICINSLHRISEQSLCIYSFYRFAAVSSRTMF